MQLYQPTITGSLSVSGSINLSGSITIAGGGTISGTASIATNAITASSADNFLVRNTLTAQTLVVQTITSSVDFVTGSTRFGSISENTHQFTGSVNISSSLTVASGSTTPTLTVANGLVGIGMNPVYKLDVGDAIRGLDILAGGNTFAYDGTIRARNAANNTNVLLHSNGSSYFLGGNVGIGIVTPVSLLQLFKSNSSAVIGKMSDANLLIDSGDYGASTFKGQIAFGYFTGTFTYAPGAIGFIPTAGAAAGRGDLVFSTRDTTTDVAPTERMRITSVGNLEMRPIVFSGVANNATQTVLSNMGKGTWLVSVANDVDSSDGYSAMLWVRTNEIIQMQVFRVDSMVFSYSNQDLRIQNTSGFAATLYVTAIRMAAS